MDHVRLQGVCASYGAHPVLQQVSLAVPRGGVLGLIGASGSGKSTVLRLLAGLVRPTAGEVSIGGETVDYASTRSVQALRSRLAIVFQQYNLFQNMTVLRNVMIAPVKVQRRPRRQAETEAVALLEKVGLGGKLKAYPDQLSGGQQQRVAIARAQALHPEILLLDEVTSALDPELVGEVLDTILLLAREGMTMLLVSHEMAFVRDVATQVALMDAGRVIESAPPAELFSNPREDRSRAFISRIRR
jgi:polar amino acid transport system ATP-binding protein